MFLWTPIQVKWSIEIPDRIFNNTVTVYVSEIFKKYLFYLIYIVQNVL